MNSLILVFVGGGLGAAARYVINNMVLKFSGSGFPWSTMLVNIIGSFCMGILISWLTHREDFSKQQHINHGVQIFLATGFLGGFTTFSTFSLDIVNLWNHGSLIQVLVYMAGSICIAIAGFFAGVWFSRIFV